MADFSLLEEGDRIEAISGPLVITGTVIRSKFSSKFALEGFNGKAFISLEWLKEQGFTCQLATSRVLTDDEVREIRVDDSPSGLIAHRYGVSTDHITRIKNRTRRGDVT